MRIEQVTRYKCDGCEREEHNPLGWMNLAPLLVGSFLVTLPSGPDSRGLDFCPRCSEELRALVRSKRVSLHKPKVVSLP